MNRTTTLKAHIREMKSTTNDRIYKVVLHWEQNDTELVDDNRGRGYPLYKAEHIFAMLTSTCVGTYEFPTKTVR